MGCSRDGEAEQHNSFPKINFDQDQLNELKKTHILGETFP